MDKPDWKDAPEWAAYLAMHENGEWMWFEHEPTKENGYWNLDRCRGRSEFPAKSWTFTMEPRP